jgi:hypothetical protein
MEFQDLTASGKDVSQNVQYAVEIAKDLSGSDQEEELLRDLFHHKQTKVQQRRKKRMQELHNMIENSTHRNILESKEITDMGGVVAFCFLSSEFRELVQQISQAGKLILKSKDLTPSSLETIFQLLTSISSKIAAHEEYSRVIEIVFDHSGHLEQYSLQNGDIASVDYMPTKYYPSRFVEMWVGDQYSLEKLFSKLIEFKKIASGDSQVRELFADWRNWFLQAKYIDGITDKLQISASESLVMKTRLVLLSPEYRDVVQSLRRELLYLCAHIQKEDSWTEMRDTISKIVQRIICDSNGQPTFKEELFKQAHMIARCILQSIQYIPLPTIHKKTEKSELVLENVEIQTHDILPSSLEIFTETNESGENPILIIKICNIKAYLSNVQFTFTKDSKVIQKSVSGKADITIGGDDGMELVVQLNPNVIAFSDKVMSLFEVKKSVCSISKLKIHLRETSHDKFYKLLSPIINKVASHKLEQSISQFVALYISKLNNICAEQANEAIQKGKVNPQEIQSPHLDVHSKQLL